MFPYGAAQLADSFRTVRKNTIRVAEEIPEEHYGRELAPGMMTIAQSIAHIAVTPRLRYDMHETKRLTTLAGYDFFGMITAMRADWESPRTKAELLELLRTEGETIATWLAAFDDARLAEPVTDPTGAQKSTLELLLSIKEHEMHHRGQLMLTQRLLGIVPHTTRAFVERAAAMQKQREAVSA
jgi:uncharacterized damage-inducible protein DinB